MAEFRISSGSIVGKHHMGNDRFFKGERNQDSFNLTHRKTFCEATQKFEDTIIGIVCDGMGSGTKTEFGSEFGARLLPKIIINELSNPDTTTLEDRINFSFEAQLQQITNMISLPSSRSVKTGQYDNNGQYFDYFFFTILAFVIHNDRLLVLESGDGIYYINGIRHEIGPFEGNCPPFFGYRLLEGFDRDEFKIRIVEDMPLCEFDSLLIASDGLSYYEEAVAAGHLMSTGQPIPPVEALYSDKSILGASDGIQRILRLVQRIGDRKDPGTGELKRLGRYLEDDTTIIAVKRVEE